jgi:hydrophobe/amphiphile efflux-1 (HAE1) family protein
MASFFIDRPVFAWVVAILLMLSGILALIFLPISQYPQIAPPAISITTIYPGASAQILEESVTQVIEQKMKGLDHLSYMASTSESNGQVTITLTFKTGTDPDLAQIQVQNKLSLATPFLPQEVQQQGVAVAKASSSYLNVLAFTSSDGGMNHADLSDYVASNVIDPISRIHGVAEAQLFGSQYAMRIWLNPHRLASFNLTPQDVSAAITAQNAQVSAGQLGALPALPGQQLNAPITAQTRMRSAEEFKQIRLRTLADGSQVLLQDVARIELDKEIYHAAARYNGKPSTGLAIKLSNGANALDTVEAIETELASLKKYFPPGMEVHRPYDTTPFVRISIRQVLITLAEAVVLVFLVMYLFLQNLRATLIPTIAVPVVLLGTCGVLALAGFSLNTLTMFAMVLAIGLLVDDAIVVIENVQRLMEEEKLSTRAATRKSMQQISGALISVATVLAAVFVPMAFFSGSPGVIYRQFSITIISAMTLSVLVALILTPALCATLLQPQPPRRAEHGFLGWFNRSFNCGAARYQGIVRHMLNQSRRYLVGYAVVVVVVVLGVMKLPLGFMPDEDQGTLLGLIQLPPGASHARTMAVVEEAERFFLVDNQDTVEGFFSVSGFSFAGTGQNVSLIFVKLKHWDQRRGPGQSANSLAMKAYRHFSALRDGRVFAFSPPAVFELGNANGFDLMLQDRSNLGHQALMEAREKLLDTLRQDQRLILVRANG